jgi:hypothetical protein
MKKVLIGIGAVVGVIVLFLLALALEIGIIMGVMYLALIGIDFIASWFGADLIPDAHFSKFMLGGTLVLFVINRIRPKVTIS